MPRQIKVERPSTIVIGLSVHQAGQIEHVLREAGASAYAPKGEADEYLYEAIVKAVRGPTARPYGATSDYSGESLLRRPSMRSPEVEPSSFGMFHTCRFPA